MKRLLIVFVVAAFMVFSTAFADEKSQGKDQQAVQSTAQVKEDRIADLERQVAELRTIVASLREVISVLQATQPQQVVTIGVMPIQDAGKIPQVGYSFRQVLISALRERGIQAVESLDYETLNWVQYQDQKVRERWIDPLTAPLRGRLQGVRYLLLATVTRYEDPDKEAVIGLLGGVLNVRVGGGARVRTASLVVDFRLVNAETGMVIDAFRTEAKDERWEYAGGTLSGAAGIGGYQREESLPEKVTRRVADQAARQILANNIFPVVPQPKSKEDKRYPEKRKGK